MANAPRSTLSDRERRFLAKARVARLATVDEHAMPHVVPVCFVLDGRSVFITIDEKRKRSRSAPLKRVRNVLANDKVALVSDRYDEDWAQLAWVMVRGRASILREGERHGDAQRALMSKYPQLNDMKIDDLPVIEIRIERVASWGALGI